MREDKLTNSIIKEVESWQEGEGYPERIHIEPEANYNYYGTRGYVDLYTRSVLRNKIQDHLYEIKGRADKANEISRQFQKMVNYFYRDQDRQKPDRVRYELCFISTPHNFNHVKENAAIYQQLYKNHSKVIITFRHPENITPAHIFSPGATIQDNEWFKMPHSENQKEFLLHEVKR